MVPAGRQGQRAPRDVGPALVPEKKPPLTVSAPEGPLTPIRRASTRMLSSSEAVASDKNTPAMQEVVENAVYFAGKLGHARGEKVRAWKEGDFVNIQNWSLWLCKNAARMVEGAGQNAEKDRESLKKKLAEKGLGFDALLQSETALFDTLLGNPYLDQTHILHLIRSCASRPSLTLLAERMALAVQRRFLAVSFSKVACKHTSVQAGEAQKIAQARLLGRRHREMNGLERIAEMELMAGTMKGLEVLCRELVEEKVGQKVKEDGVRVLEEFDVKKAREALWTLDPALLAAVCALSFIVFNRYATYLLVRLDANLRRWREREAALGGYENGEEDSWLKLEEEEEEIVFDSQAEFFDHDPENSQSPGKRDCQRTELALFGESADLLKDPEMVMDEIEHRLNALMDQDGAIRALLCEALCVVAKPRRDEVTAIAQRLSRLCS